MNTQDSIGNITMDMIKRSIDAEIEREVSKIIDRAKDDLGRRIPEIVAGLSIKIMQNISLEYMRNELLVRIKMDNQ